MAEITNLSRLVDGVQRNIKLKNTTLGVNSIKFYTGDSDVAGIELTKTAVSTLVGGNTSDAGSLHMHDGRYTATTDLASTAIGKGAALIGINDASSQFTAVTVEGALDEALDAAQAANTAAGTAQTGVNNLVTLSGVSAGATHLGTFTGSTIADSDTVKQALQDLETALETSEGKVGHLVTLSGVAASSDNLGTFTGATIADSATIKGALQDLETAHETLATSAGTVSGKVNDLISLSGVAANATHLGTFTGTTIPDSSTEKQALQALETAVETKAADAAVIKKDGSVAFTGDQSMGSHKLTNVTAGTADADAANFKQLTDGLALKVNKAGDTLSGFLTLHADPTSAMHAVTKQYADAIAAGFDAHASVHFATTVNLVATAAGTQVGKTLTADANGAFTVDGHAAVNGDRILVKEQTTQKDNGLYVVTDAGSAGTPFILTRSTDFDGSPASEVKAGDFVWVEEGLLNGGKAFAVVGSGFLTVDTDALVWTQVSGIADVEAGAGLSKVGTVLNVNVDDSTIGISADALYVKNGGITATQLGGQAVTAAAIHADVAGAGLTGGNGSALAVNAGGGIEVASDTVRLAATVAGEALGLTAGVLDVKTDATTIEVASDALRIKDLGVSTAKIAATAVTAAKLGSDVAGTGLSGGNGSALAIDFGVSGSKAISATDLAATTVGKGASLIGVYDTAGHFTATDVEAALAESAVKIEALQAGAVAIDIPLMNSTGVQINVGSVVILSQTAAGKIELAKADVLATCEGVVGIAMEDIADSASGKVRICGEATVGVDANLDIGKRVYVSAANAGKAVKTAPSATNSVAFLLGHASATNKVVLNMQLVTVNE